LILVGPFEFWQQGTGVGGNFAIFALLRPLRALQGSRGRQIKKEKAKTTCEQASEGT